MECAVEMDDLAASLVVELPDVSFAGAVSQYVAHAASNLALVVARLELVSLNRLLRNVGEGCEALHESLVAVEEQRLTHHLLGVGVETFHVDESVEILVAPVGIAEPVPLETEVLLHVHESLRKHVLVYVLLSAELLEGEARESHSRELYSVCTLHLVAGESDAPARHLVLHEQQVSAP